MPKPFSPARRQRSAPRRAPAVARAAASRSPSVKRARACGRADRRAATAHRPVLASAPKRSAPVTFGRPSILRDRAPTAAAGRRATAASRVRPPTSQHRLDDLAVAGAAAQHAAQRVHRPRASVGFGLRAADRSPPSACPACRCRTAPRRAMEGVAAARRVMPSPAEALDRGRRRGPRPGRRNQACADLPAVEQHGAGAAIAGVAADLGAGQAELVAQHLARRLNGGAATDRPAVHGGDRGRAGGRCARLSRRASQLPELALRRARTQRQRGVARGRRRCRARRRSA